MIERFSRIVDEIQVLPKTPTKQVSLEEQMFVNRLSIQQLLEVDFNNLAIVTVKAKVIDIDNRFGWCYISCNICKSKLARHESNFKCEKDCRKECKFPVMRYKIHLSVSDQSGCTTFVLFNDVAEKLLDTTVNKLVNNSGATTEIAPPLIEKLIGKTFVFSLKLNDKNINEGLENYCVRSIYNPNEHLELQFKARMTSQGLRENQVEPGSCSTSSNGTCKGGLEKGVCQEEIGNIENDLDQNKRKRMHGLITREADNRLIALIYLEFSRLSIYIFF
ncbi:hypothetical protein Scep_011363 [Stephania cephalantha]|uniref:Replication factor A C-terminal domain-containing protein n=1 Tax=Stephania cephalantha TaxID=152367 RepID=A0AAP0JF56_9MAGN